MNASVTALAPIDYWSRHAEAWVNIAGVQYESGDLPREEFYDELADAAKFLTEVYF